MSNLANRCVAETKVGVAVAKQMLPIDLVVGQRGGDEAVAAIAVIFRSLVCADDAGHTCAFGCAP